MDKQQRVAAVRRFNRFYTRQIGVLREGLLKTPFSLTESRVLYELAHGKGATARDLCRELGLDPGYVSRMLSGFEKRGLIEKTPSVSDARQSTLALTPAGWDAFIPLDARSDEETGTLLGRLPAADQERLTEAMATIEETLLGSAAVGRAIPYLLRPHRPGDIGWVVSRHGALYAEEQGWSPAFEGFVAEIAGQFIRDFDPKHEACWIAEREGVNVGSVFLVKRSEDTAQLRMLLVEPGARGLGIGRRLVEEAVRFARQAGYARIMLWTNEGLTAARHLYEASGFRLTAEEKHREFGPELTGQSWELMLRDGAIGHAFPA